MAVVVFNSAPINMGDPIHLGDLLGSDPFGSTSATSFSFQHPETGELYQFGGTGFSNYIDGAPSNGTLTSLTYSASGSQQVSITGFSVPIASVYAFLAVGDWSGAAGLILAGDENVTGSSLNDLLLGYGGADTLSGGQGVDSIDGGAGSDVLHGGDGSDFLDATSLNAASGVDALFGDDGNDVMVSDMAGDTLDGGAGIDAVTLTRSAGAQTLTIDMTQWSTEAGVTLSDGTVLRNVEAFTIAGSASDDTFTLVGKPQAISSINGSGGNDTFVADFSAETATVTLGHSQSEQANLIIGEAPHGVTLLDFERYLVTGGSNSDSLGGAALNDVIDGGAGNDSISGMAGNDTLTGGEGNDVIGDFDGSVTIPAGDDVISGGAGNDWIFGGGGHNTITGGAGDDVVSSGGDAANGYYTSVDDVDGGDGVDRIWLDFRQSNTPVDIALSDLQSTTGFALASGTTLRNFERIQLFLGGGDDAFTADAALIGDNTLDGGAGQDTFNADFSSATEGSTYFSGTLTTSTGRLFISQFENFSFSGGSGNDVIEGVGTGTGQLFGNDGNDGLTGAFAMSTLSGGNGDDGITSNGIDSIDGGSGVDHLTLYHSNATQNLTINLSTGGAIGDGSTIQGIETISAFTGSGDDTLTIGGAFGANSFTAGEGNDTLVVDFSAVSTSVSLFTSVFTGTASTTSGSVSFNSVENLTVLAGSDWDTLGGGASADLLDGGDGNDDITGGGGLNTLRGGAGDDSLTSTSAGDSIDGGAGADYLTLTRTSALTVSMAAIGSNSGATLADGSFLRNVERIAFNGGAGVDTFNLDTALNGQSWFNANGGADKLIVDLSLTSEALTLVAFASTGTSFYGSAATSGGTLFFDDVNSLWVFAGSGNDTLFGAQGADTLAGGVGDDSMLGGAGADAFNGGSGVDIVTYELAGAAVQIDLLAGTGSGGEAQGDTLAGVENITGTAFNDTLTGNGAANALGGLNGNDSMAGGAGADTLMGGFGNDTLDGGAGADSMFGGQGDDIFYVDNAGDVVGEDTDPGVDTIRSTVGISALAANVEKLELLGSALTGNGNTLDNVITGNASANTLDGKIGADTMIGGAGDDTYVVGDSNDVVIETAGGGTDTIMSSWDVGSLTQNVENLRLNGTSALIATGNSANNVITGNAQNNTLNGGAGEDTLIGGFGNDTYFVNSAGDVVTENASEGFDTITSTINVATLTANVDNLTLVGTALIGGGNELANVIIGNGLGNTLTGGLGGDQLNGAGGADTMSGGEGDDSYLVENAGDVVNENSGEGFDTLYAFVSISSLAANVEKLTLMPAGGAIDGTANGLDNRLNGNDSANVLTALGGNDVINGLGGADHIIGGAGLDNITGGAGDDVFVYSAVSDSGLTGATRDVINDFTQGADTIDLSAIDAITGGGDDAFTLIGASAFTHTAGELRYDLIDAAGTANDFTLISMDVNGDGAADSQITLRGLVALSAADFVL